MGKNRRRQYLVKKDYQSRFILRFAVITTIWSVAAILLFALFAGRRLEEAMYSSHVNIASASELLLPSALYAEGLALLLYVFLLAYAVRGIGKNISIPLFMLKKDIARIGAGDLLNSVGLRPDDEFQDLAADVEKMRKELGRRFSEIKEEHEALASAVSELDRACLQDRPLQGPAEAVKTAVARMKETLHAFTR